MSHSLNKYTLTLEGIIQHLFAKPIFMLLNYLFVMLVDILIKVVQKLLPR